MFQSNISVEDFSKVCRFCLDGKNSKQKLNPIFNQKNTEWTTTLNEMIRLCLNLSVGCKFNIQIK